MRTLRVLLVGAGSMGAEHGAALHGVPGVEIAGFVGRRKGPAEAMCRRFGGTAFRTMREGLKSRPDAVFVLTPTPTHRTLVAQAAAAGCAVLCEKPLAGTLRDAEAILATVRRTKVPFMTAHVLRWFPEFRRLRALVRDGSLGSPAVARLSRGGQFPEGSGGWYARASGGPLLDLVIHDFDWLRWTFGPIDRVFARQAPRGRNPRQSFALALIRHRSGPIAHVEGAWGHGLPFRVTAEIAGSKGLAEFDSLHPAALEVHAPARPGEVVRVAVPRSPLAESPYRAQDLHFLECIRTGAAPLVSPDDALAALKVSLAALRSARTGKAVRP